MSGIDQRIEAKRSQVAAGNPALGHVLDHLLGEVRSLRAAVEGSGALTPPLDEKITGLQSLVDGALSNLAQLNGRDEQWDALEQRIVALEAKGTKKKNGTEG